MKKKNNNIKSESENNFKKNKEELEIKENMIQNLYNKQKEMEIIIIMMEIDMRVIGKMIKRKEKEFFMLIMEIDMKVIIKMVKEKEKE